MSFLAQKGIDVKINYPIPIHLQDAASGLGHKKGDVPVAERLAEEILSLPISAEISMDDVDYVIESVLEFSSRSYCLNCLIPNTQDPRRENSCSIEKFQIYCSGISL